ncbi:MAG: ParB/Srx family N-terminal domain-containing protein [Hyphomicrobiaceae bacterium]|nr:ParB/Srx family N-terminal domain-containing protein [Hyphomicrobiaceae bacterium]
MRKARNTSLSIEIAGPAFCRGMGAWSDDEPPRPGKVVKVPVEALRPTQMAVGMRTVTQKRLKLESVAGRRKRVQKLLEKRSIPVVLGPGGEPFLVDHHHFGLALWQAGIETTYARIIADLTHMAPTAFWRQMETEGRLYPFDENGERVAPGRLPTWLHALRHDTYRDMAAEVRDAGGFAKVAEPYAEFRWADFFRARIPLAAVRRGYEAALAEAVALCRSRDAAHLPGYRGRGRSKEADAGRRELGGERRL